MRQHDSGSENAEEFGTPPSIDWDRIDPVVASDSDHGAYLRSAFIGAAWCVALLGIAGLLAWCGDGPA